MNIQKKRAFVFPGQGSQSVGMGHELYQNNPIAREVFENTNTVLSQQLTDIIFYGPEDQLTSTINAQPALVTVSIAILRTLLQQTNKNLSDLCQYVAGHSLGEYSALCASNAIDFADTINLVRIRGNAMMSAYPEEEGAMAACNGINIYDLESILKENAQYGICEIANDNNHNQIVISGSRLAVDKICSHLNNLGIKTIKLKVSAPFHSSLMTPAAKVMEQALQTIKINKPEVPIISNISAKPITDITIIPNHLTSQICGRVRWRETIDFFLKEEIGQIVEIGNGSILTNLIKRHTDSFELVKISNQKELDTFAASL